MSWKSPGKNLETFSTCSGSENILKVKKVKGKFFFQKFEDAFTLSVTFGKQTKQNTFNVFKVLLTSPVDIKKLLLAYTLNQTYSVIYWKSSVAPINSRHIIQIIWIISLYTGNHFKSAFNTLSTFSISRTRHFCS